MNEMSYLFDSAALLGGIVATECMDVTHAELVALGAGIVSAQHTPGRARVAYKLSHAWMRKRLNAGCVLPEHAPTNAGPAWFAARTVVASSGRQPAPVFDHALHYHMTYVLRAKATGGAA